MENGAQGQAPRKGRLRQIGVGAKRGGYEMVRSWPDAYAKPRSLKRKIRADGGKRAPDAVAPAPKCPPRAPIPRLPSQATIPAA